MKLKPVDIDRIMANNVPKPVHLVSAADYISANAEARDALLESLSSYSSTSTARDGEILPPPPKSLATEIDTTNDFGIPVSPLVAMGDGLDARISSESPPEVPKFYAVLPSALRGIDLARINSRADLISSLTVNLPLNEMGLPKFIYRADMLDWRLFCGAPEEGSDPQVVQSRYDVMADYLEMATLHLSYTQGFPALTTGEPLWSRFPSEPQERFGVFLEYCEQSGTRQVNRCTGHQLSTILEWFHEDYWAMRAHAYDMVNAVHAAKIREQRVLHCEDNHYLKASHMWEKLCDVMSIVDWTLLQDDPKQLVEVMEKVVKLQRLSLGLSTMGNASKSTSIAGVQHEELSITMRKMAGGGGGGLQLTDQSNGGSVVAMGDGLDASGSGSGSTEGEGGTGTETDPHAHQDMVMSVRRLLKDPSALASAQELVIRMVKSERLEQHVNPITGE